jgi:excisionase family DNA binding protein
MTTRPPFLTTEEAAQLLELDPRQVLRLIDAGDLPGARKLSSKRTAPYIIPTEAVDALIVKRKAVKQKRERSKKPRSR